MRAETFYALEGGAARGELGRGTSGYLLRIKVGSKVNRCLRPDGINYYLREAPLLHCPVFKLSVFETTLLKRTMPLPLGHAAGLIGGNGINRGLIKEL